ncbi:MAG TPA: hypothetical protein VHS03_14510 [Gaiellaceae bacterium]|jgi:hypothetical protein|nr:hypothetical protein [Gaiellaceae bacterium]
MDCRDRFAVWLVELALEPVRALRNGAPGPVTVRTALGERRFDVTIARESGGYDWRLHEAGGPFEAEAEEALADPEDAFWAAWTAIETTA